MQRVRDPRCVVMQVEVVDGNVERCSRFVDEIGNPACNFVYLGCSLGRCREWILRSLLKKHHLDVASGERCCFKRHSVNSVRCQIDFTYQLA
jgi:hypothetical protein